MVGDLMDVEEFTAQCRDLFANAQEHVAEVEAILMTPSDHGWLVFGLAPDWDLAHHARMMNDGVIPLVNPADTAEAWRPYFQQLGISCGMLVAPAVVFDLGLGTHVEALIAVLHHPDQASPTMWGVRVLEGKTCEPFPALDQIEFVPLGQDWMEKLLS